MRLETQIDDARAGQEAAPTALEIVSTAKIDRLELIGEAALCECLLEGRDIVRMHFDNHRAATKNEIDGFLDVADDRVADVAHLSLDEGTADLDSDLEDVFLRLRNELSPERLELVGNASEEIRSPTEVLARPLLGELATLRQSLLEPFGPPLREARVPTFAQTRLVAGLVSFDARIVRCARLSLTQALIALAITSFLRARRLCSLSLDLPARLDETSAKLILEMALDLDEIGDATFRVLQ